MRKWQSHKIVEAESITHIGPDYVNVSAHDGNDSWIGIKAPENFFFLGTPEIGDYVIRLEDDYLMWLPKKLFEGDYSEVRPDGLKREPSSIIPGSKTYMSSKEGEAAS